jgi:hypothetical protein
LRRTSRPFVTEVKRRHSRSTITPDWAVEKEPSSAAANAYSFDAGAIEKREAAQLLERVFEKAPARPTGRILPSLVESGSLSEAEAAPGLPKRSRQSKASKSVRPNKADVPANDLRPAAFGNPEAAPRIDTVVARSAPAAQTKVKLRPRPSFKKLAISPQGEAVIADPSPLIDVGSEVAVSRKGRRSILPRYGFGAELKLGERWKLRLLKRRR